MFHLVNITNPSEVHSAPNLADLFNPIKMNWIPADETRGVTYLQWFTWLQHTITEDNWLDHLAHRVMRRQYCTIDEARDLWEYKLVVDLLKDHPKWLVEVITPTTRSRTAYFDYYFPTPDHPIDYGYNNSGEFRLAADSISVDPGHRETVNGTLRNVVKLFTDHIPRYHDTKVNATDFYNVHSQLIARMMMYSLGLKIVTYRRSTSDRASVSPSYARGLILQFENNPETKGKYKFNVEFNAEGFAITLYEPKRIASRDQLSNVLNYSTDVLDYLPYNIRSKTELKTPLYGIELETATAYHPREVIAAQAELFFLCKQDGSITGNGAHRYEMVTVPATFKAHRRLWAEWFNKLDYSKFDTSKNTGNGMHVHIDREAFSTSHLNKFTWFFINPANFDFLFEVSERPNKNDFLRWAPAPYIGGSKTYAIRNAVNTNKGNRGIIHFKKTKTVEVRMFKGVVSYATIMKNLEFVDSVFYFTLQAPTIHNTMQAYLQWLNSLPANQYKLLREFISQLKNLDQLTLSNTLKDYLFNLNTPEQIIDKLRKAPFEITNKHLTVLNRERRKRTFILNKDGTLSLAYTTGGKLASLDKEMQAKITRGSASFTMTSM